MDNSVQHCAMSKRIKHCLHDGSLSESGTSKTISDHQSLGSSNEKILTLHGLGWEPHPQLHRKAHTESSSHGVPREAIL